jgi:hypothetical protein
MEWNVSRIVIGMIKRRNLKTKLLIEVVGFFSKLGTCTGDFLISVYVSVVCQPVLHLFPNRLDDLCNGRNEVSFLNLLVKTLRPNFTTKTDSAGYLRLITDSILRSRGFRIERDDKAELTGSRIHRQSGSTSC